MKDYLLIIDGSSLLSTQFYGNLPREIVFAKTMEEKERFFPRIMQTSQGVYTNAVYGFLRVLLKILKEQKPKYLAVTWDVSRNTFRRELYPDYKGNRSETMAPLKEQFVLCQQVLRRMNVPQFMDEAFEADDFSGTLAAMFENQVPVRIMTKDHDYLQLVSDQTQLWMIHPTAKKTEELYEKYGMHQRDYNVPDRTFPFDAALVEKEFGVKPESVPSLKGLQGDSADNIKGVPGIGEMTAVALIHAYETVENLYDTLRGLDDAQRKKLAEEWKQTLGIKRSPMGPLLKESDTELVGEKAALLSKQLATIKRDIPLSITLQDLLVDIDIAAAQEEFTKLEFKSLKLDFGREENESEGGLAGFQPTDANPFEQNSGDFVSVALEMGNPFEQTQDTLPETGKQTRGSACRSDENAIGLPDYREAGVTVDIALFSETMLSGDILAFACRRDDEGALRMAVMCQPDKIYSGEVKPERAAQILFAAAEKGMKLITNGLKEQLSFFDAEELYALCEKKLLRDAAIAAYLINPLAGAYDYTALAKELYEIELPKQNDFSLSCNLCYLLWPYFEGKMRTEGLTSLFYEIEMPLVFTLYHMQERGICVRGDQLREYGEVLGKRILVLEEEIHTLAGEVFNINSPKQLGVILFEKLGLPGAKKTKNGYSTSAEVLERLAKDHPIVEKILEYRQLAKLKSTYADALGGYIAADGRIHGTFHQTVTATGRISSTDPNLQNIPIRMEAGRQLRRVFVPQEGFVFLDADYSQIELRVLAHMSADSRLIAAYNESKDIHRITASQVFHTPFEEVTKEQRSRAKAVNFGIVYGISSFGLGQDLNISRHEAEEYMESYFKTYPGVRDYMDRLVEEAKESGICRTLFGRIRPLPDILSTNSNKRQAEERVAMNAPIQGTAADIMKLAMLRVDRRLTEGGFRSRLLLQIHDELLVETAREELDSVRAILIEEMSHAAKLAVPLEVSVDVGENWLDAH